MKRITLKQIKNGKWKAGGPALRWHSVIIEEETPDKALASAKQFLDVYEEFIDHLYGCCGLTPCDYCKTDKEQGRQTRGLRTGKRPKRYDANPKKANAKKATVPA
jgi:hypothetical protein